MVQVLGEKCIILSACGVCVCLSLSLSVSLPYRPLLHTYLFTFTLSTNSQISNKETSLGSAQGNCSPPMLNTKARRLWVNQEAQWADAFRCQMMSTSAFSKVLQTLCREAYHYNEPLVPSQPRRYITFIIAILQIRHEEFVT